MPLTRRHWGGTISRAGLASPATPPSGLTLPTLPADKVIGRAPRAPARKKRQRGSAAHATPSLTRRASADMLTFSLHRAAAVLLIMATLLVGMTGRVAYLQTWGRERTLRS